MSTNARSLLGAKKAKALTACLAITAGLLAAPLHAAINHEETLTGPPGAAVASVTVNNVAAGTNQLYLVSVAIYEIGVNVNDIDDGGGTGLTWVLQKVQCSARISQPRVEIWQAFGSPGSTFNVTVNLTGIAIRVSAAVSRYSGVDTSTPTEGVSGSNTNGQGAAATCGLGTDNTNLTLSLTSMLDNSVLFVASTRATRRLQLRELGPGVLHEGENTVEVEEVGDYGGSLLDGDAGSVRGELPGSTRGGRRHTERERRKTSTMSLGTGRRRRSR